MICAQDYFVFIAEFCRRALWQYLESKVAPLLAMLVAYMDADDNLDLLTSDNPMMKQLWLAMFKVVLFYSNIIYFHFGNNVLFDSSYKNLCKVILFRMIALPSLVIKG